MFRVYSALDIPTPGTDINWWPPKWAVRILLECFLVTVRNKVAKVMFLRACVCPQEVGGVPDQVHPPGPGTPPGTRYTPSPRPGTPPGRYTPPPRYGQCCGRYASYWNAFLFSFYFCGYHELKSLFLKELIYPPGGAMCVTCCRYSAEPQPWRPLAANVQIADGGSQRNTTHGKKVSTSNIQ